MTIPGTIQPINIKENTKILKLVSCSCHDVCFHAAVYAIDDKGVIYRSRDAINFLPKEDLTELGAENLFPTEEGVAVLIGDGKIICPERHYETLPHIALLAEIIKEQKQNENQKLNIIDLALTGYMAAALLSDGRVVLTVDKRSLTTDFWNPWLTNQGLHTYSKEFAIIPSDKLLNSCGEKASKIFIQKIVTNTALILSFDNSDEICVLSTNEPRIKRISTGVNIAKVATQSNQILLFEKNGSLYFDKKPKEKDSLNTLWKSVEKEKLYINTGGNRTVSKKGARAMLREDGLIEIQLTNRNLNYDLHICHCSKWEVSETFFLPEKVKQVAITEAYRDNKVRMNILMENGEVVLFSREFDLNTDSW